MLEEIEAETTQEDYRQCDRFTLVIISHGTDNEIVYGSDGGIVQLSRIYDLLSNENFPLMSGKRKWAIAQSCYGGL